MITQSLRKLFRSTPDRQHPQPARRAPVAVVAEPIEGRVLMSATALTSPDSAVPSSGADRSTESLSLNYTKITYITLSLNYTAIE